MKRRKKAGDIGRVQLGIKRFFELKSLECKESTKQNKIKPQIGASGALSKLGPRVLCIGTKPTSSEGGGKRTGRGGKGSAKRPLENWLCLGKGPPGGLDKVSEPVRGDKEDLVSGIEEQKE